MATQSRQIYRCDVCGIVVEVLEGGAGEPVCCGQPMRLLRPDAAPAQPDLHVPLVERRGEQVHVRVGRQPHPMDRRHWIQWIDVAGEGRLCRQLLAPGDSPEAQFTLHAGEIVARAYCSLHGLWKGQPE